MYVFPSVEWNLNLVRKHLFNSITLVPPMSIYCHTGHHCYSQSSQMGKTVGDFAFVYSAADIAPVSTMHVR